MINTNDILQTIQMIDHQHLDVRTITMERIRLLHILCVSRQAQQAKRTGKKNLSID